VATTAQSLLATSNTTLMSPLQVREAFNASNDAPVYACRAWCTFDGSTVSSSLSGTYTRVVGTTLTVCVATAHGMITGNVQYIDFVTGGASDNSYIVTVTDADTFTVNTVSTSSILTSTLSLKRCPILSSGNIANATRLTTGTYYINFTTGMPTQYYSYCLIAEASGSETAISVNSLNTVRPTQQAIGFTVQSSGGGTDFDSPYISSSVFA
jgi:hypothetical protein